MTTMILPGAARGDRTDGRGGAAEVGGCSRCASLGRTCGDCALTGLVGQRDAWQAPARPDPVWRPAGPVAPVLDDEELAAVEALLTGGLLPPVHPAAPGLSSAA